MIDVILEAIFDALKAFIFIFIIYIIFSFLEFKIANKLSKENHMSPFYGSLMGLIPQCGVSVVAADLYLKRHISVGTLIAIFISCSDEALPLLLSSGNQKALMAIPLIIVKFIVGFISGFLIDLLISISKRNVEKHLDNCNHHDIEIHTGCCHHHIDDNREDSFEKHLWHPFLHSLKLLGYILVINIIFGMIIYFIGEDNLISFLLANRYISPLFATLIGLIPNCASSIILTELYISGGISFGATLSGLCVNAGLGLVFLFKSKNGIKRNLAILFTLVFIALFIGYLTCLIIGF
jgi:hypothetical protein